MIDFTSNEIITLEIKIDIGTNIQVLFKDHIYKYTVFFQSS